MVTFDPAESRQWCGNQNSVTFWNLNLQLFHSVNARDVTAEMLKLSLLNVSAALA